MDHHGEIGILPRAFAQHRALAATVLLRRSAQQLQSNAHLLHEGSQRDRGTHTDRGDDIMSAAMANLGERIVLNCSPEVGLGNSVPISGE